MDKIPIATYFELASGHNRPKVGVAQEHDYAKSWSKHPDPQMRIQATQFLFMKNFPYHLNDIADDKDSRADFIDIMSVDDENKKIPFLAAKTPTTVITETDFPEISEAITESWSCEKNKLWTRANKILDNDRVVRLTLEGQCNEVLLKRNLLEQTATKFRELLGSTFWEPSLVRWLHETLIEYLDPNYKTVYLDALHLLRIKLPELIDSLFLSQSIASGTNILSGSPPGDPLQSTLNHFKLKKLSRKPIILVVPFAPNFNVNNSTRYKSWMAMFNALGKVITMPCVSKSNDLVGDILNEIRFNICEKIRTCRANYAGRPLILIGFNVGSLIALHCALQFPRSLCAVICIGFPLQSLNGPRGELGDPFLELSVPIQFIVGENSLMCSLDDLEDFRERMMSAETSMIVVGGSDDRLVMAHEKMRSECLSQSMVDRMIGEMMYDFLEGILAQYKDEVTEARLAAVQQQAFLAQYNSHHFNNQTSPRKRSNLGGRKKPRLEIIDAQQQTMPEEPPKPKRKRYYKPKTPKPVVPVAGTGTAVTPAQEEQTASATSEAGADAFKKSVGGSTTIEIVNNASFGSLKVEKPKT